MLQQTAVAMGTTRENVIRRYIRDGHSYVQALERKYQEAQRIKGIQADYMILEDNASIGDDEGHP